MGRARGKGRGRGNGLVKFAITIHGNMLHVAHMVKSNTHQPRGPGS